MRRQLGILVLYGLVFAGCYFVPVNWLRETLGQGSVVVEAAMLVQEYAREHVLLCLVPAMFIAGAIGVFLSQGAVMRYLGPAAKPALAYGVASVSGAVLAVCSCTILPLFAGIHRMGAGLGPATTFLYAGPAINVLAILLTARVLGPEMGVARAVFAVIFGIVIGLLMQLIFRERRDNSQQAAALPQDANVPGGLGGNLLLIGGLVGFLIFATWQPTGAETPFFADVAPYKWPLAFASLGVALLAFLIWKREQGAEWVEETWDLAKKILPLLLIGVVVSGFVFGTPTGEGLIPRSWIQDSVGGNSLSANFAAAASGALMYFATLTEIPILEGLLGRGMGQGPALALLLAGPAISLPSLLVIRGVLGLKKTLVFAALVIALATVAGKIFGTYFASGVMQ
jgi:uncharacterized membrane protein YraQ (UPF0718 family)